LNKNVEELKEFIKGLVSNENIDRNTVELSNMDLVIEGKKSCDLLF